MGFISPRVGLRGQEIVPRGMLAPGSCMWIPSHGKLVDIAGCGGSSIDLSGKSGVSFSGNNGLPVVSLSSATIASDVFSVTKRRMTLFFVGYTSDYNKSGGQEVIRILENNSYFFSTGFNNSQGGYYKTNWLGTTTGGPGVLAVNMNLYAQATSIYEKAPPDDGYGEVYITSNNNIANLASTSFYYEEFSGRPAVFIGSDGDSGAYLSGGIALVGYVPGVAWTYQQLKWFSMNAERLLRRYYLGVSIP